LYGIILLLMDSNILNKQCYLTKSVILITENEVVTLAIMKHHYLLKIKTNSM
jgi:hypothetical protein